MNDTKALNVKNELLKYGFFEPELNRTEGDPIMQTPAVTPAVAWGFAVSAKR
jgi:hypothetical protein